jgi:phage regulator Rha-like protein
MMNNSEILIYRNPDGKIKIDVRLEEETVWLTQEHMAELFGKSKKTISEHIRNIFHEGELDESMVVRKFRTTTRHGAIEGKTQSRGGLGNEGHCPYFLSCHADERPSHGGVREAKR